MNIHRTHCIFYTDEFKIKNNIKYIDNEKNVIHKISLYTWKKLDNLKVKIKKKIKTNTRKLKAQKIKNLKIETFLREIVAFVYIYYILWHPKKRLIRIDIFFSFLFVYFLKISELSKNYYYYKY